jgi:hypothetical protein
MSENGIDFVQKIQTEFMDFVLDAWGPESATPDERARRFLEEAVELAQACGVGRDQMWRIFSRVTAKPPGVANREFAQAQLTLLGVSAALGMKSSAAAAAAIELNRLKASGVERQRQRRDEKRAQGLDVA